MKTAPTLWATPRHFLCSRKPDLPVAFFAPSVLHATARDFASRFPGLLSYAVKANADPTVIGNLHAAGVAAFDVASPVEIDLLRQLAPTAALHYNNPVRSRAEITHAVRAGIHSYSVDSMGELAKLVAQIPKTSEISVRLRLPVSGAAYDFGDKFGADPALASRLLQAINAAGFTASLTFHPGTQCHDPAAWTRYITTCATVAKNAGVSPARLNVGGGFPAHRSGKSAALRPIFREIIAATQQAFGPTPPALLCEPGRALVSNSHMLAVRIKALHDNGAVYLNDGIYGGLTEFRDLTVNSDFICLSPDNRRRQGKTTPRTAFGPTCDSLDKLPAPLQLPEDATEGDYLLFAHMGAYVNATVTRFNGYGNIQTVAVNALD